MSKRGAPEGNENPPPINFRPSKLKRNAQGNIKTEHGAKKEKDEDKALDQFLVANKLWAERIVKDGGEVLYNSPLGEGYKIMIRAYISDQTKFDPGQAPDDEESESEEEDTQLLAPARSMTENDITTALTSGFVEDIQDPQWMQGSAYPVLQVVVVDRQKNEPYCGSELNADSISLTLADRDGYTVCCRVAAIAGSLAASLGKGYVIEIQECHRYMIDLYDNGQCHPGLGILSFRIIGRGNVVGLPKGYPVRLIEEVAAFLPSADDDDDIDEADGSNNTSARLEGWDYTRFEPPPVPPECTAPGRECSIAGVNFFRRCICDECPVSSKDLKELQKVYFAADKEVDGPEGMSPAEKRNMLYWSYATDTYGWHGWSNRQELPSCLIFMIRKAYPNPKGTAYVEFQLADPY